MEADQLQEVFRKIFKNPNLVIHDETTAADVDGWDSIAHLELVLETEERFGVRFSTAELGRLRNVGDFVRLIQKRKI